MAPITFPSLHARTASTRFARNEFSFSGVVVARPRTGASSRVRFYDETLIQIDELGRMGQALVRKPYTRSAAQPQRKRLVNECGIVASSGRAATCWRWMLRYAVVLWRTKGYCGYYPGAAPLGLAGVEPLNFAFTDSQLHTGAQTRCARTQIHAHAHTRVRARTHRRARGRTLQASADSQLQRLRLVA